MDILTDYLTKKKKEKLVISTFFKNERERIELYCNNLQPDHNSLDLKLYWADQINEFAKRNSNIQIIKDYYLIDFVDLEITRKNHLLKNKMKLDVLEMRTQIVNSMIEYTQTEENTIDPLSSASVFQRLETERKKLNYQEDLHKKDLLYYHIIDLATSNNNCATHNVFSRSERKKYQTEYKSHINICTDISRAVKNTLKDIETKKLKHTLKDAKRLVRSLNDSEIKKKKKKKVLKVCKVYRDMLEIDNENKFGGYLNEVEYTHQFIFPILKQVIYDCQVKFRLGESHLQCAAANTNDDQRTQSGPKIDIIILHKIHQLAISICEISGPNNKTNRNHFLGDRNKLAKNMRAILSHIEDVSPTPNETAFKKIKLYSVQVYLNTLYIYSLTSVGYGYSVFVLEKTLSIPVSLSLLQAQLPAFLGWLWNLNNLFKQMIMDINSFIDISKQEEILQIDSHPSSTTSSQESNSNKRQKHN